MKNVRKSFKESLSLLLAIMMIVTTCSVALTASAEYNAGKFDAKIAELVTAMTDGDALKHFAEGDGVTFSTAKNSGANRTRTLTADTYADFAQLKLIGDKMVEAFKLTSRYTTYPDTDGSTKFSNIKLCVENLTSALSAKMGSAKYAALKVNAFISMFVDDLTGLTKQADSSDQWTGNPSPDVNKIWYKLTVVTTDWRGFLKANASSNTDNYANIKLQFTFQVGLSKNYYNDGCGKQYAFTFHKGSTPPSCSAYASTAAGNKVIDAIDNFKNSVSAVNTAYPTFADIYDLYIHDRGTFNNKKSDMETKLLELKSVIGDADSDTQDEIDIMKGVYPDYNAYMTCMTNFQAAYDSAEHLLTAKKWNDFAKNNPNYGEFSPLEFEDGEQLKADYATFKTEIYDNLYKASPDIVAYFYDTMIDEDYFVNFGDNVQMYTAREVKTELDDLIENYEDVDVNSLTAEEQSAAAGLINGYISTIEDLNSRVVADESVFSNDLVPYYTLKARFDFTSNSYVEFFTKYTNANLADLPTSELLGIKYSTQLSGLNKFYDTISSTAGKDVADSLLADLKVEALALDEEIYATLGARFASEVANAYAIYQSMGGNIENITVQIYYDLSSAMRSMETEIYDRLKADGVYNTTNVPQEQMNQYSQLLLTIIPKFEAYAKSFGFATYEKSTVEYLDREVLDGDVIKEEEYDVTAEKLDTVIKKLNTFLVGEDFSNLVLDGKQIKELVMPLLSNAIYSDSLINTLTYTLYTLVQGEFDKVWAGLPLKVDITDPVTATVDVNYKIGLPTILKNGGLCIYPSTMSEVLAAKTGTKFADNVAKLKEAGELWQDPAIYDVKTGALTLEWGVDELKANPEATDEQIAEQFYTAIGGALEGLLPLGKVLLCGGEWNTTTEKIATGSGTFFYIPVSLDIHLDLWATKNDGYVNTLGPIFDLLGYKDYKTAAQVTSDVNSMEDLVRMLFGDLFAAVEGVLDQPLTNILDILPNAMYAMVFDMIPSLLGMIKTDIGYKARADVLGFKEVEAMKATVPINIGEMLSLKSMGIDTSNGINGILSLLGIELKGLNEGAIATMGDLVEIPTNRTEKIYTGGTAGKAYHIDADQSDVFYYLLTYIVDSLKDGSLYAVLGKFMDVSAIENIVSNTLNLKNTTTADAVGAIVELLNEPTVYENPEYFALNAIEETNENRVTYKDPETGEVTVAEKGWTFDAEGKQVLAVYSDTITYTDSETGEKVTLTADTENGKAFDQFGNEIYKVDPIYTEFWTKEKAEYVADNLPEFVLNLAKLANIDITEIIDGFLTSLYTKENVQAVVDLIQPMLSDDSITSIVDTLAPLVDNVDISAIINSIATFEVADFETGDRDAFLGEFARLIAPAVPVLKVLFFQGYDLTAIDGSITVLGYDGYYSAIVPILEAISCDPASLKSADELKAMSNEDFVKAIIDPIVGVVDEIAADPIDSILAILPNILYFINSDGLNTALINLLTPVYSVLDTIRPIYDLDLSLNINIAKTIDSLLAGINVEGIAIPSFGELMDKITSLGATKEYDSVTGEKGNYLVIDESFMPELISIVLYTLVDSITYVDNISAIVTAISEKLNLLPDQAKEMLGIWSTIGTLESKDEILFILYYLFYGIDVSVDKFVDVKDLVTEEMKEVLEEIGGYESGTYAGIAGATDDLLGKLEDKLEDWGMGDKDSLNFFQKIAKAFEDFFNMLAKWFGL